MQTALLILLGGGVGSLLRYGMSLGVYACLGRGFPYGTLVVNVVGSFLMGLLAIVFIERLNGQADYLRPLLLIGLLGGFTTMSTFSIETFSLFEQGAILKAACNVLLSFGLCLVAVTCGALLGRQL